MRKLERLRRRLHGQAADVYESKTFKLRDLMFDVLSSPISFHSFKPEHRSPRTNPMGVAPSRIPYLFLSYIPHLPRIPYLHCLPYFRDTAPNIKEVKLIDQDEVWDVRTESFSHVMLVWVNESDTYLCHKYFSRRLPEDPSTLLPLAQVIPSTYYQAKAPLDLTRATDPLPPDTYLKKPIPLHYDPDMPPNTTFADLFLKEAKTCEQLAQHPHRHLCEYRGYVQKDGFVSGLCFRRYGKTLYDAVQDGDAVDAESVLAGVRSGIEHIHGLGLVHNDINPFNIVLDDEAQAVIIDFDSCCAAGSHGGKGGTPGWCKDVFLVAEVENDWYAFEIIKKWLLDPDHTEPEVDLGAFMPPEHQSNT